MREDGSWVAQEASIEQENDGQADLPRSDGAVATPDFPADATLTPAAADAGLSQTQGLDAACGSCDAASATPPDTAFDTDSPATDAAPEDAGLPSDTPPPPIPSPFVQPNLRNDWPTFQGDRGHTGNAAVHLDEHAFARRWEWEGPWTRLSAVTVQGNDTVFRVAKTVRCLDTLTGAFRWAHDFTTREHVSPPGIGGGKVYVHAEGVPYVWGLDARNGLVLFQAYYPSQGYEWLAPTLDGDTVFTGGGYYGGANAWDASSGARRWSAQLNQYDRITPTVLDALVVVYYPEVLRLLNKQTGADEGSIVSGQGGGPLYGLAVAAGPMHAAVIQAQRLVVFDLAHKKVLWALDGQYRGQVAAAEGLVFAATQSGFEARELATGALVWSWAAGSDDTVYAQTPLITATHLFFDVYNRVTDVVRTVAISRHSRKEVWSYPLSGKLSLARGMLFIAADQSLAAIDLLGDTDADGLSDSWELSHGSDLGAQSDPDGDGLTSREEQAQHTSPLRADSDDDGLADGEELVRGTNPGAADTDLDGLLDGAEVARHATDPRAWDSDSDGLDDGAELGAGLDPKQAADAIADADGDGFSNRHELRAGTDLHATADVPRAVDWGMIQGNARHDGYQPLWLDARNFQRRWSRTLTGPLVGTATGAGRVFLSNGSATLALDRLTGNASWSHPYTLPSTGAPYEISAPSYAGNRVYVHTGTAGATLWALDAATGGTLFAAEHEAQWPRYGQPTIVGDRIFMNGGRTGGMISVDAQSGVIRWYGDAPWKDDWEPAADGTRLYVSGRGGAVLVHTAETGEALFEIAGSHPIGTLTLSRRGQILVGNALLTSVDVASKGELWRSPVEPLPSPDVSVPTDPPVARFGQPAVGSGAVFAVRAGALEVFREDNGGRSWGWAPATRDLNSNVVVTASHVFVASARETYAIDLSTRMLAFMHPHGGALALGREGDLIIVNGARVDSVSLAP